MEERSDIPGADARDLQAIAETLRGNSDAFRVIVDHYSGTVFRMAKSFLGNREEAEEASQEIFFKVFRSLWSFRLERPFPPWLFTIARNYLRTRYVRNRRIYGRIAPGNGEMQFAAAGSEPPAVAQAMETREELRKAVASLPPGIQEAVSLYYLEAMSVSQVSVVLGIGNENVKSRLLRGRKKLREILDPEATG